VSIVAGTLKYDLKKFWLGVFIGELIKCMIYAYAGFYGIKILGF
jgi:membrane protein DedA with SNARE-associated domain